MARVSCVPMCVYEFHVFAGKVSTLIFAGASTELHCINPNKGYPNLKRKVKGKGELSRWRDLMGLRNGCVGVKLQIIKNDEG